MHLLARIVSLGLAVFFACGSDLVGIGPFRASILIGGHRFPAGLRSRLIAHDPATAADAPPISRANHHRAGGRTPRAPAITSPASGSNRGGRERAKRGAATYAACQSPSAPSVGRSRNLRNLGSLGGRPRASHGLVPLQSMVRLAGAAGDRVVHPSAVSHPKPRGPACRCAAEDDKADPSDFHRQNH